MDYEQIASFQPALANLLGKFRHCFKREKTFAHWQRYILGLMADLKRKSIEPIALSAGVAVRTLQEFLAFFKWDHKKVEETMLRLISDEHDSENAIGVLDATSHPKQGDQTPGVQRQWCGQTGKNDNCVIAQHLLYSDNHPTNPFNCIVASDLYLPQSWDQDRQRCRKAHIPDEVVYRPRWRIGIEQLERVIGQGIRFGYITFDEEYGRSPEFWFELDRLGQRAIGEVPSNFYCWSRRPAYTSLRSEHSAKRVDNLVCHSPVFRKQQWQRLEVKDTTRGIQVWYIKSARVHLTISKNKNRTDISKPTDRQYWLIAAENRRTKESKYFVSNAPSNVSMQKILSVAFSRWHIEQWFERAKQECGLGAFEVRTYTSLIRHWLSSRIAMYFLASHTQRLRGEKSVHHAGAGGRRCQYACLENMGQITAFVEESERTMSLLSGA
jgi:SRSO17 transposase